MGRVLVGRRPLGVKPFDIMRGLGRLCQKIKSLQFHPALFPGWVSAARLFLLRDCLGVGRFLFRRKREVTLARGEVPLSSLQS